MGSSILKLRCSVRKRTILCNPGEDWVWLGEILTYVKFDVGCVAQEEELFCLPLFIDARAPYSDVKGHCIKPAGKPGDFCRHGVFIVRNEHPDGHRVEKLGLALKSGSESQEFAQL